MRFDDTKEEDDKCIKSVTTYTIRSGGFLWLNLCETMKNNKIIYKTITMFGVNCSSTEVVGYSGLQLCWSVTRRRYFLIVCRIRGLLRPIIISVGGVLVRIVHIRISLIPRINNVAALYIY